MTVCQSLEEICVTIINKISYLLIEIQLIQPTKYPFQLFHPQNYISQNCYQHLQQKKKHNITITQISLLNIYYYKMKDDDDLILGRFRRETLLKKTQNKRIWLLFNISANQYYIGKFQNIAQTQTNTKIPTKNVLHQAAFLLQLQGHVGIPLMYWSGPQGNQIFFICQYLGFTLQQLLQQCHGKFTLKTTCILGINIINNLRILHEKGLLHRCLKPNALQLGRGFKSREIYFNDLIDCKRYRNKKSFVHINTKKGVKYLYENNFGSNRFHNSQQLGRIDDIQNVINLLIYFYTGVKPNNKGQFPLIKFPTFLKQLLDKCDSYGFYDQPNYQWFIQKLNSILFHSSYENDGIYDWMLIPQRLDLLRVNKHIVSLQIDQDRGILSQVYDPYQQSIDIDEIATKHFNYYGSGCPKLQTELQHRNSNTGTSDEKIKRRKLYRKEKSDCGIM